MNEVRWNFDYLGAKSEAFAQQLILMTLCSKKKDFKERTT